MTAIPTTMPAVVFRGKGDLQVEELAELGLEGLDVSELSRPQDGPRGRGRGTEEAMLDGQREETAVAPDEASCAAMPKS